MADEPALQFIFVLKAAFFDEGLGAGAGFPLGFRALVAADVDELAGEEVKDFGEDVLQEADGLFFGVKDVLENAPLGSDFDLGAEVAEFGIGGNGGLGMAGHFDFGHHVDVSLGGILHHVANVLLGVEAAVGGAVVLAITISAEHGFLALAADFGELRILLDLDSPALVVGEVPVERVQLVHRHEVDEAVDFALLHKVAGGVEHESAPLEAGGVFDFDGAELNVSGLCAGCELGGREKLL